MQVIAAVVGRQQGGGIGWIAHRLRLIQHRVAAARRTQDECVHLPARRFDIAGCAERCERRADHLDVDAMSLRNQLLQCADQLRRRRRVVGVQVVDRVVGDDHPLRARLLEGVAIEAREAGLSGTIGEEVVAADALVHTPTVMPTCCSRTARRLGQRRLLLAVDLKPSVIEAPNATTEPVAASFLRRGS